LNIRLWPGVVGAAVIVLARMISRIYPVTAGTPMIAGFAGTAIVIVWWLFFSRAPWSERIGALLVTVAAVLATKPFLHDSITHGAMAGMVFALYDVPLTVGPALVVWAAAARRVATGLRRATMVVTIVLACAVWTLVRMEGVTGVLNLQFAWRWTPTPEERLLATSEDVVPSETTPRPPSPAKPAPSEPSSTRVEGSEPDVRPAERPALSELDIKRAEGPVEWAGFRGTDRDGIVHSLRIETDWAKSPPVERWRRPVGPGWSSFAVAGDFFYTQEQRGGDEIVASYRVSTGKPVWRHRDAVRFQDASGDVGPRGTPTVSGARLYAFGATGVLNALDANSGRLLWSRNVASDTNRKPPDWGFASSPLVLDDVVIVAASGTLAAYDAANGERRWIGPRKTSSYSSPHRVTIAGVEQILLISGSGVVSVAPGSGEQLWEHAWEAGGAAMVQPAMTADGDVLISAVAMPAGAGIRRLSVSHDSNEWKAAERWTSTGLKPHFNDFVIHKGHAYGFDGSILSCIDLQDGARKWKGGRYGNGQLVLLADQDVLLVISEEGELALVGATPDQFKDLARFKAIEGKTWNHPALAGDVLLLRNGAEMAAFKLPVKSKK
jgi:outer membrane protein assembly factor BamB